MSRNLTRRRFLASSAAAAAAVVAAPAILSADSASQITSSERKLKIGLIGVGGRGADNLREISAIQNAQIVALCDVDSIFMAQGAEKVPQAAKFEDFREMLKLPGLEGVVISTPDHTHAVAMAAAMRAGKHVYCEKPLTHTIQESREIVALAEQSGVVTQMGIQIHAMENYRRVVELIRAGAIGPVREVHVWNQRTRNPVSDKPVDPPARLNYDLWLGPLPPRQYLEGYHPFSWRYWWAFGSGLLGDIAPHLLDIAFWALDLKHPTRIEAEGESPSDEVTTRWIVARYDFPARGDQPPVKLTWYDPPKFPPMRDEWKLDEGHAKEGVVFVGDEGLLYTNYKEHRLLPEEKFKDFARPEKSIPPSPGHQAEWINACLKNDPSAASAPFSYGSLLTEAGLLGTIAFRAGKALEWDAQSLKFPNAPEAERFLRKDYRAGWSL